MAPRLKETGLASGHPESGFFLPQLIRRTFVLALACEVAETGMNLGAPWRSGAIYDWSTRQSVLGPVVRWEVIATDSKLTRLAGDRRLMNLCILMLEKT
jgi:hypothetical protein